MVDVNFDDIEDSEMDGGGDFGPLPPSDDGYHCIVNEVHVRESEKSGEYWGMEWKVIGPKYKNRRIFDNLFFTQKSLPRLKMVMSRLGFKTEGSVDLKPEMMIGCEAILFPEIETGRDGKERNVVPYAGYQNVDDAKPTTAKTKVTAKKDDGFPF